MPGISPRFRGLSRGGRTRRRRPPSSSSPPLRSIFGARLRTRWPQYGHSVTYGLTSDEQFLQTTKRSGSLTTSEDTRAKKPLCGLDRRGGVHDLAHDLAQVVVGLVDDQLPRGAGASVEQVLDPGELVCGAELLGVVAHPVEHAHGQLAGVHALRLGQVHELLVEPVSRG